MRAMMKGIAQERKSLLAICTLALFAIWSALPGFAGDKKHLQRVMIEKMEAVPCGAHEHGMAGLGAVWASVGITSVNSDEKLCPQYMLRTDDMEYHVRPLDHKHPILLPIGQEGEFTVHKDVIEMRIADGDRKQRRYQVVVMKPIDHANNPEVGGNRTGQPTTDQPTYDKPSAGSSDKPLANQLSTTPAPTKPN
jgi:hypothetical protein